MTAGGVTFTQAEQEDFQAFLERLTGANILERILMRGIAEATEIQDDLLASGDRMRQAQGMAYALNLVLKRCKTVANYSEQEDDLEVEENDIEGDKLYDF